MGSNRVIPMEGFVFGDWTVVSFSHKAKGSGNAYWNCRCVCGENYPVDGSKLRKGKSVMCKKCSGKMNGRKGLYSQSKDMKVYFIRCGDYVKIGASHDPNRRLKDIQSANPYKVTLEFVDEDEEFWHRVFKHNNHRGEWYYFPT